MSGLYLYCLVPADEQPPRGLVGLDGVGVEARGGGGVSAWVSSRSERPHATLSRIREHHRVVQAATARVTPLPVRFGEWLPAEDVLAERLGRERERLLSVLEAVQGALEYALCITDLDGMGSREAASEGRRPAEPMGAGRAYLRGLARDVHASRDRARRRDAVVGRLRERVTPYLRGEVVAPLDLPGGLASVAHLVERVAEPAYRDALAGFLRQCSGLRFELMGPWPPYSFAP